MKAFTRLDANVKSPVSKSRAAYWLGRAADNGVVRAHYDLAVLAYYGLGTEADVARARVSAHDDARSGHARVGEPEGARCGPLAEEPLAAPQDERKGQHPQLEPVTLRQRPDQRL